MCRSNNLKPDVAVSGWCVVSYCQAKSSIYTGCFGVNIAMETAHASRIDVCASTAVFVTYTSSVNTPNTPVPHSQAPYVRRSTRCTYDILQRILSMLSYSFIAVALPLRCDCIRYSYLFFSEDGNMFIVLAIPSPSAVGDSRLDRRSPLLSVPAAMPTHNNAPQWKTSKRKTRIRRPSYLALSLICDRRQDLRRLSKCDTSILLTPCKLHQYSEHNLHTRTARWSVSYRSSILTTVHDLDLPGRADLFPILYDLAHVARWDPYNLNDLTDFSWVGSVYMQILYKLSRRQVSRSSYICPRWATFWKLELVHYCSGKRVSHHYCCMIPGSMIGW